MFLFLFQTKIKPEIVVDHTIRFNINVSYILYLNTKKNVFSIF